MPERPSDEPAPGAPDATTDELVESGTEESRWASRDSGDESGEEAIAKLGLEARAELERLRARLGLLGESSDAAPGLPTVVGRYRLLERIGHGGMGVVYRAHDPELGRAVAIKLVHAAALAAPEKLRARLLREAKVLAKLTHPNVVRVYDCGQHEGEVYLAMEHVAGRTLREWQSAGVREREAIVDAYVAAAKGLAAVHAEGIVHRDFKPDNVLVADDGRILVGDFGLAVGGPVEVVEVAAGTASEPEPTALPADMTKTGALLGTVLYMAPEQLRGDPATASSDQFAFCVALWEALAGARPFAGDDRAGRLAAIERGPQGGERLPSKLRRALVRGLSLEPRDRFPSIDALAGAIARRRGPSALSLLALAAASVVVGALLQPLVCAPASSVEECDLERALAEVREHAGWDVLRSRLTEAGVGAGLQRLEAHVQRLDAQARALCQRSNDPGDEAQRQHLRAWVESLASMLAAATEERALGDVLADVEALEHAQLTRPPPRALDEDVLVALQQSEQHERQGELDQALATAEHALALAGDHELERSAAHARRGRVLALQEQGLAAMVAYGEAASNADAATYDDARLDARLLAARSAIMRLEQVDRGRDALAEVRGLLVRLGEPWPSPRRADYHELHASLLKREGRMAEALREQWQSLVQRTLLGEVHATGLGYVNLGTIYERRALEPGEGSPDDVRRALDCYERALELLQPTHPSSAWGQAAYNLGRALASLGPAADYDQAERLLELVRQARPELRFYATKELLLLLLQRERVEPARARADELLAMLQAKARDELSPGVTLEAWSWVSIAYAYSGDLLALERALVEVEAAADALAHSGAARPEQVQVRRAELEVTIAHAVVDRAPERARALARAARARLVSLPAEDRPADLLAGAEEIIPPSPE